MNHCAANFLQVGGEGENAKVTLADFKVGGYNTEEPDVLEAVKITKVNGNGIPETDADSGLKLNFSWQDFIGEVPPGWYDDEGGLLASAEKIAELQAEGYSVTQSVFGDAATVEFPFGTGIRVTPSSDYAFTLTFSGEVRQKQSVFNKLVKSTFNLMGNCSPVEVKLSQMTVGGYNTEEPDVLEGVKITRLNGNGIPDTDGATGLKLNYSWQDFAGEVPAGWYDDEGGILVSAERLAELKKEYPELYQSAFGDAANVKFPAGYGFRVTPSSDYNFTLTIPSPMGE